MISKNIYAEIFFQINCLYSCLSVLIRVFQKSGFHPKILSCAEMHFLEIRSKVKNHHISEAGVSFQNIVWSVYQDMGWTTHFLHMAANYRLKVKKPIKLNFSSLAHYPNPYYSSPHLYSQIDIPVCLITASFTAFSSNITVYLSFPGLIPHYNHPSKDHPPPHILPPSPTYLSVWSLLLSLL